VDRSIPGSFVVSDGAASCHIEGFNDLYFSFMTLGTVGYGDSVPVSRLARVLAMIEAVFDMFYMALMIARLVSLYTSSGQSGD
jgi:hypothetical protein